MQRNQGSDEQQPAFLQTMEVQFDSIFKPVISYVFYQINLDHYSKFTKISLFVLLGLLPLVIYIGGAFITRLLDFVDPIPELVPTNLPAPKIHNIPEPAASQIK